MTGNVQRTRSLTDVPVLLRSDDSDVNHFLLALGAPVIQSHGAKRLWAVAADDGHSGEAGTAYIVSAEAAVRIKARRLDTSDPLHP